MTPGAKKGHAEYALYVESGPRKRKTMVHVLQLLGCAAQGPTTEDALAATPAAIQAYLRFLQKHGERVDPDAPAALSVAAHVMEGSWIGQGDPEPGFEPDFAPLPQDELDLHLRHLAWLRADLLDLLRGLPPEAMLAEGMPQGRPIFTILRHIAEAQCTYLRYTVGRVEGLLPAMKAVERGPEAVSKALAALWEVSSNRLAAMTPAEREQVIPHGHVQWTARRGLRRMLEHEWEHCQELSRRLA